MAYTDDSTEVTAIIAEWAGRGGAIPSSTQITTTREMIAAEIDGYLAGQGVTVPVTSPARFATFLATVETWGVAASILKSAFPAATGPGSTPAYAFWEERYQRALKGIMDGSLIDPSAPLSVESFTPVSYFTENPDEHPELGDVTGVAVGADEVW